MAKDVALGGIAAAAGLYLYNRFLGQPLVSVFHMAGKYAGIVAAAAVALAFDYVGNHISNQAVANGFDVAGYAVLGMALKSLIPGDPPVMTPMASGTATRRETASAFQGLSPVPLAHEVI